MPSGVFTSTFVSTTSSAPARAAVAEAARALASPILTTSRRVRSLGDVLSVSSSLFAIFSLPRLGLRSLRKFARSQIGSRPTHSSKLARKMPL